jgi:hypothetical protein
MNQASFVETVLSMLLSLASSSGFAETDPGYITKNAVNAYASILDKPIIDRLTKYQVVMLGEVHGTSEYTRFALDLVKSMKAAGKKITLALEIPANFQTSIQNAIKEKDLGLLASTEFFRSKFQDGRSSLAMALLIMAAAEDADILCFDKSWTIDATDRDLEMAKNVTQYVKQNPDRTIVLLGGNYHTRLEEKVTENKFTPMGYYLSRVEHDPIASSKIFSIMGRSEKGSNWACYTNKPEECGVKQFQNGSVNYASAIDLERYFLVEPTLQDGHHATLFVRTTSASVPLETEWLQLKECNLSSQHLNLMKAQDFWTFDQTPFGHRYLSMPPTFCKLSSAKLIDGYLLINRNRLLPYQRSILYFHAGQDYAMGDAYIPAISRFQNSFNKDEAENPEFHWNAYVSATIAFLKKDRAALTAARAKFPDTPTEGDATNVKIVDRFLRCFESTYLDAYSDSGSCAN